MHDETRHVEVLHVARSTVFRLPCYFGEVSEQASYAEFAYAAEVRLPTLGISRSGLCPCGAGRF